MTALERLSPAAVDLGGRMPSALEPAPSSRFLSLTRSYSPVPRGTGESGALASIAPGLTGFRRPLIASGTAQAALGSSSADRSGPNAGGASREIDVV